MKKTVAFYHLSALFIIAGILSISGGCTKEIFIERDPAFTGSFPIVGTSQTGFWDGTGNQISAPVPGELFYGQDAQFTYTAPVYTKSSDGLTVKDEITGLTWQKSYDSGIYYWAATQTVVNSLNRKKYGGYNDWRLPTIKELYSLWNASTGWPSIDTNYFDIN